ncbi:MAG: endonuclease/exonuclease/phosphatase family protein [Caldilineaceae bacterium]|nr:endonuclease/exonuclease/phosphatase family protein [Caldilineaceae bacterium]
MASLSLLTFNTFAILNWDTIFRVTALAEELTKLKAEIVCLQEIHQHLFRRTLTAATPYHVDAIHAPKRGRPRGGLLTLSRLPVVTHNYIPFVEQGRWYHLELMDRLLEKGLLVTHYEVAGLPLIIANTHIIANYAADYGRTGRPALRQQSQLRQLATVIKALPAEALVVLVGDFNLPRGSWLYQEFLEASGMEDTMSGDQRPTYRPLPGVPAHYALPIDFVFVRHPQNRTISVTSNLCMDQPVHLVGNYRNFLSDHLGIISHFSWPIDAGSEKVIGEKAIREESVSHE